MTNPRGTGYCQPRARAGFVIDQGTRVCQSEEKDAVSVTRATHNLFSSRRSRRVTRRRDPPSSTHTRRTLPRGSYLPPHVPCLPYVVFVTLQSTYSGICRDGYERRAYFLPLSVVRQVPFPHINGLFVRPLLPLGIIIG
jgi:hypothetical protein